MNPKKKVLIIEDELAHLDVMRQKLEKEGYNVAAATDGEAGYTMITTMNPDLILLDVILPKINGFDILERMQKDNIHTPVIVVSNSGQPVEVDRALALGALDFLVKAEFDPSDVVEKVRRVLGDASAGAPPGRPDAPSVRVASSSLPSSSTVVGNDTVKTLKILIIEDDRFLRDLIQQKLTKEGFTTLVAVDGEEGVKIAKEQKPHLVLLDLILPGIDGFEILRKLKSDAETSAIPVIVLSNLGQKEDMDRAMKAGAEDFMVKAHFTPTEIVSKIRSILEEKYFR